MIYSVPRSTKGVSMKTCSSCNESKEESEFQVRKASKDGLTASCKKCLKERDAKRYLEEREIRSLRQKAYMKTPEGIQAHKRAIENWRSKNTLKRAAHVIFNNAIKYKKIMKQPCFICGEKAEAHHPDYSRPLDVVWLCAPHHRQAHNNI